MCKMINMLGKGIKFSIQWVYFPQSYFESKHYGKRFSSIGKFKSLTFQLRAIYFYTFAVEMSVQEYMYSNLLHINLDKCCFVYFPPTLKHLKGTGVCPSNTLIFFISIALIRTYHNYA